MTRIGLVLDCADPQELAKFWAPALDYAVVGGAGAYVLLVPPDPSRPKLLLQRVAEGGLAGSRAVCAVPSRMAAAGGRPLAEMVSARASSALTSTTVWPERAMA